MSPTRTPTGTRIELDILAFAQQEAMRCAASGVRSHNLAESVDPIRKSLGCAGHVEGGKVVIRQCGSRQDSKQAAGGEAVEESFPG